MINGTAIPTQATSFFSYELLREKKKNQPLPSEFDGAVQIMVLIDYCFRFSKCLCAVYATRVESLYSALPPLLWSQIRYLQAIPDAHYC